MEMFDRSGKTVCSLRGAKNTITNQIRLALTDICHGDSQTLIDFVEYYVADKGYSLLRLVILLEKRFGIPRNLTLNTLQKLY